MYLTEADAGAAPVQRERTDMAGLIRRIVEEELVEPVFQPIVELATGRVVGYEALARGPEGSPLASPADLFRAARAAGIEQELDWTCARVALRRALASALPPGRGLFLNVEAATLERRFPEDLGRLLSNAGARFRVMVEVTERAVMSRPAELLDLVAAARRADCGLAMDDIGVEAGSLAVLPFVHPDVVKLDMTLVQGPACAHASTVATAVMAYAESSGAVVLAEGIETPAHARRAATLGATLGQGWLYGRPAPLPLVAPASAPAPDLLRTAGTDLDTATAETPYTVVSARRPTRPGDRDVLVGLSKHLECTARSMSDEAVVVGAFQTAEHFTGHTRRRYSQLAETCSLVAAIGVGLDGRTVEGVRGADLAPDDPLTREWSVAVVGAHFAGALVAREMPPVAGERRFDFAVTHDRGLVVAAARTLLARVARR